MSDPVTNVEIEDVLASIRRLVAKDEDRSRAAPEAEPAPAAEPVAETPTPAPLVLTPSLRVAEPASEEASEAADEGDVPEFVIDAPLALETPISEDAPESSETSVPAPDRTALLSTIAELEAAVGKGSEDWERDGGDAVAPAEVVWDVETPVSLNLGVETLETVEDAVEEAPAPEPFNPFEASAPFDTLSDTDEDAAPEATVDNGDADEADPLEAEPSDDLADEIGDLDIPAALTDEDLRDMVTEIVRQELQGALGERITRNVRKLVRREIYRILASEEFD